MGWFDPNRGRWRQLWPSVCLICQRWPSQPFCPDCIESFAQPRLRCPGCACASPLNPICSICGWHGPMGLRTASPTTTIAKDESLWGSNDGTTPILAWCLDQCYCAVDYQYPWSICISQLKYSRQMQLARPMAELMVLAEHAEWSLEQCDGVVPIPISAPRLAQRGFNQALALAHHFCRTMPHKLRRHMLERRIDHGHQAGASRGQRVHNIQQAFEVPQHQLAYVQGQRLLLIDDVLTTGATLNEAAQTLKRAGAARVQAMVFARAVPKSS